MKKIITILFFSFIGIGFAEDKVELEWQANSEKDLAGYRLFYKEYGVESFDYKDPIFEGNVTTCEVTVPGDGDFVIRAFDKAGNESGDSNVVKFDPAPADPKALLLKAWQKLHSALKDMEEAYHAIPVKRNSQPKTE